MTLDLMTDLRLRGVQIGAHIGKHKTTATAFFDDGRQITTAGKDSDRVFDRLTAAIDRELLVCRAVPRL